MSDPFGFDHLSDPVLTAGGSTGFLANIQQGFEQQFRVDSPLSLETELQNRWLTQLTQLQERTGEVFDRPSNYKALRDYAEMSLGRTPAAPSPAEAKAYNAQMEALRQADERIAALDDPELRPFADVVREVMQMQQDVEARTGDMAERGGLTGAIGQFVGAVGGAFSTRDPVSLFTLPIGGGGRTVARRVLSEMAVGGAAAAAVLPQVQENRALAGLAERSMIGDIAVAAVGAGAFRGVFEGAAAGVRRLRRSSDPDTAALQDTVANAPETARTTAVEAILDDTVTIERANPYGAGAAAETRFLAELADVGNVLNGTSTMAIARALPPLPFEYVERAADFQLVKEQSPEVWARLEQARASVTRASEEVSLPLESSVSEGMVRVYHSGVPGEGETSRWVSTSRQYASDYRSDTPLHYIDLPRDDPRITPEYPEQGPDKGFTFNFELRPDEATTLTPVSRATSGAQLAKLRVSRGQANERLRIATAEVEAELRSIKQRQATIERLQNKQSVDLLGYATHQRPFVGPLLRHEVVEERVGTIDKMTEGRDDTALQGSRVQVDEETGLVDVGGRQVSADLRVPITDADGNVVEASVREILEDLADDEALETAVKSCMI
jgi:hypothetical protein